MHLIFLMPRGKASCPLERTSHNKKHEISSFLCFFFDHYCLPDVVTDTNPVVQSNLNPDPASQKMRIRICIMGSQKPDPDLNIQIRGCGCSKWSHGGSLTFTKEGVENKN